MSWCTNWGYLNCLSVLLQFFIFFCAKTFLTYHEPRRYLKFNIPEKCQPILTNRVSNESSSLKLLILRKKKIEIFRCKFFLWKLLFSAIVYFRFEQMRSQKLKDLMPFIHLSQKNRQKINNMQLLLKWKK